MIRNRVGETVKFSKDLNCAYSANEMPNLTVYNPLLRKYQQSEDWGSDEDCDTLFIGGFNAEITKSGTRLFFGESVVYGFFPSEPSKLLFIPPGHSIKNFIQKGSDDFEQKYIRPSSMRDLSMFIDNYIFKFKHRCQELFLEHQRKMSEQFENSFDSKSNSIVDDDIPF